MRKAGLWVCLLGIAFPLWGVELQEGDLLFQMGQGSAFEQAVAAATEGLDGAAFTHVGIVERRDKKAFVWEASPRGGVRRVPLADFLAEAAQGSGGPAVEVFRLKEPYRPLITSALKRVKKLKGRPYDFLFQPDNEAYYCSELVQAAFMDGNGRPIFPSAPMSFADKTTGQISPLWRHYFAQRGADVPQGVPGTNPGDMSKSGLLERVYRYYEAAEPKNKPAVTEP